MVLANSVVTDRTPRSRRTRHLINDYTVFIKRILLNKNNNNNNNNLPQITVFEMCGRRVRRVAFFPKGRGLWCYMPTFAEAMYKILMDGLICP